MQHLSCSSHREWRRAGVLWNVLTDGLGSNSRIAWIIWELSARANTGEERFLPLRGRGVSMTRTAGPSERVSYLRLLYRWSTVFISTNTRQVFVSTTRFWQARSLVSPPAASSIFSHGPAGKRPQLSSSLYSLGTTTEARRRSVRRGSQTVDGQLLRYSALKPPKGAVCLMVSM